VHSKAKTPAEIESFVKAWSGAVPLVLVPTSYPELTGAKIEALQKVKVVIYGNHAIRAAVTGMKDVFARIIQDGGIQNVNADIVPVEEIFRLQDMAGVREIEKAYLR